MRFDPDWKHFKTAGGYDFRAGYNPAGIFRVDVMPKGSKHAVAEFSFDDHDGSKLTPVTVHVATDHRRKGLATAAYDWASEITGIKMEPSSSLSPDAKKFWKARSKAEVLLDRITESAPFTTEPFKGTLYHGTVKSVAAFDVKVGRGRFGPGLYLALDPKWARFHAEGGRQGAAGQKLKIGSGHLYAFQVDGKALVVHDEEGTMQDMQSEYEPAEDAFRASGDLENPSVTKHLGDWAREQGVDMVIFNPKESGVLTPIPQVLVLNQKAIKSWKEVK